MEDLIASIFLIIGIGVFCTLIFFALQVLSLRVKKLKRELDEDDSVGDLSQLQKDIGYLMAENEDLKEELHNIKYLLNRSNDFIDLSEHEKEQIRIDQKHKYNS